MSAGRNCSIPLILFPLFKVAYWQHWWLSVVTLSHWWNLHDGLYTIICVRLWLTEHRLHKNPEKYNIQTRLKSILVYRYLITLLTWWMGSLCAVVVHDGTVSGRRAGTSHQSLCFSTPVPLAPPCVASTGCLQWCHNLVTHTSCLLINSLFLPFLVSRYIALIPGLPSPNLWSLKLNSLGPMKVSKE